MISNSYTLREVAELLGISKRTLQRRLQEGVFPGRFLAPGRHGLETRIPASEVEEALSKLRKLDSSSEPPDRRRPPPFESNAHEDAGSRSAERSAGSLVPFRVAGGAGTSGVPSSLTQSDLESMRDAMLAIVREDREMFFAALQSALRDRDRQFSAVRTDVQSVRQTLEGLRLGLERLEGRLAALAGGEERSGGVRRRTTAGSTSDSELDALRRDVAELEAMLSAHVE